MTELPECPLYRLGQIYGDLVSKCYNCRGRGVFKSKGFDEDCDYYYQKYLKELKTSDEEVRELIRRTLDYRRLLKL